MGNHAPNGECCKHLFRSGGDKVTGSGGGGDASAAASPSGPIVSSKQAHEDEERRLAHVGATRAKDWLIFVSVGFCRGKLEKSMFEDDLARCGSGTVHERTFSLKEDHRAAGGGEGTR